MFKRMLLLVVCLMAVGFITPSGVLADDNVCYIYNSPADSTHMGFRAESSIDWELEGLSIITESGYGLWTLASGETFGSPFYTLASPFSVIDDMHEGDCDGTIGIESTIDPTFVIRRQVSQTHTGKPWFEVTYTITANSTSYNYDEVYFYDSFVDIKSGEEYYDYASDSIVIVPDGYAVDYEIRMSGDSPSYRHGFNLGALPIHGVGPSNSDYNNPINLGMLLYDLGPMDAGESRTVKIYYRVGEVSATADNDGDGETYDSDCNDFDDEMFSGAHEVYDGKVNDCKLLIDGDKPEQDVLNRSRVDGGQWFTTSTDGVKNVSSWGTNASGRLGNHTEGLDPAIYEYTYDPIYAEFANDDIVGNIVSVEAGMNFAVAVTADGYVNTWGANYKGQDGWGINYNHYDYANYVVDDNGAFLANVVAVSAGYWHALALDRYGDVWAWGNNAYGALGLGDTVNRNSAHKVIALMNALDADERVIMVTANGGDHSMALTSKGRVFSWGVNNYGQLGLGGVAGTPYYMDTPSLVNGGGIANIVQLENGTFFTLAVDDQGNLWGWGIDQNGQIGDRGKFWNGGYTTITTPSKSAYLSDIIAVSGGNTHSMALAKDGVVWSWGYNNVGQLGDGTTVQNRLPREVTLLSNVLATGDYVKEIAADYYSSAVVTNDGEVYTWGYNNLGQLGRDTSPAIYSHTPSLMDNQPGM